MSLFGKVMSLFKSCTVSPMAISVGVARLCVDCDTVVCETTCPVCGSKAHLMLGNVLKIMDGRRYFQKEGKDDGYPKGSSFGDHTKA